MISPFKYARTFHRPKIGDVLDHADLTDGAFVGGADIADIRRADIPAIETFARRGPDRVHCFGQWDQNAAAFFDQVQNSTARRAWPQPGQLGQKRD